MVKEIKLYNQYIKDVQTGKRLASELETLSVLRHVNDLKKVRSKDYPFYFSTEWADLYIDQIKLFRLVEGKLAGQPFPLQPFQAYIVAMLFGWREKKTDYRRFNDSYIQMPKKNAKSTLSAAIIAAMFFLEFESMGQYLFAATTRKQAQICFKIAKAMIKKYIAEFEIQDMVTMSKSNTAPMQTIYHNENQSVIETVSKEADNIEGSHPNAAVNDEYHLQKYEEIINNLKSAMAGREQPLMLRITTPGNDLFVPCYGFAQYCENLLRGIFEDDTLFAVFYQLDPEDDIYDRKNWPKGNPNLGESPTLKFLETQATQARNLGGQKEIDFKTKHMGRWASVGDTWIRDELVTQCMEEFNEEDYMGFGGVAALDLAETKDILAFGMKMNDGTFIKRYFITEKKMLDKTDGVNYEVWAEEGHIIITTEYNGEVIDYNLVEEEIIKCCKDFNIRKIYYDRRFAAQLVQKLTDKGIKCAAYNQGFSHIGPALSQLEDDILKQRIRFNCPITRWMFTNVRIRTNNEGLRRVVRDSRTQKIDGVMTLIMCTAAELIEPKPKPPQIFSINI